MKHIYLVPTSSAPQDGSKGNPFSVATSTEFDALMRSYAGDENITFHLNDGTFLTQSTREWEDTNAVADNPGFRVGRHWVFTSETNATLKWDHAAVPDAEVTDVPRWLFCSTEARFDSLLGHHTPEQVWALLPRGQSVRNLTIDLDFSGAIDRWRLKGVRLRIGGGILAGHQASYERLRVENYGAFGYEGFPLFVQGSLGRYDRNLVAQLDPERYIFDADLPDLECSHITDCSFGRYEEADSNDQVTMRMIAGGMGERTPNEWVQHMRAFAYQTGNDSTVNVTPGLTHVVGGPNMVQAHTLYQTLRGLVEGNRSHGCVAGYYGDFYKTKGVTIRNNEFLACRNHGVQIQLGPTGPGNEQFSHEGYVIGPNRIESGGANVYMDTYGPPTATRYIRDIRIDAALTVENKGATDVVTMAGTVPLEDLRKRRGCL